MCVCVCVCGCVGGVGGWVGEWGAIVDGDECLLGNTSWNIHD